MGWFPNLVLWLFLLVQLAWGTPAPWALGDEMARLGDYDRAERAYLQALAQSPPSGQRQRLLYARLALAQARNRVDVARQLAEELLRSRLEPAVALRVHLVRGAIAFRIRDLSGARQAFAQARPLAEALVAQGDPGGALALYECMSYEYLQKLARGGRPASQEYSQACLSAHQAGISHPPGAQRPLWAMDILRSLMWTRYWVWQAWEYSFLAYHRKDQAVVAEWYGVAYAIATQSGRFYWQAYERTQDYEYVSATLHTTLELAEASAEAPHTEQLLKQLQPLFVQLESTPTLERSLLLGRYHRSWARWQFFNRKDPAAAMREYDEALSWFAKGGYAIDQMDVLLETAYVYLLEKGPANWEGRIEANLQQLLKLAEDYGYASGRYYGLGFYGVLQSRRGQLAEAEKSLRGSLQQMSDWERESNASPQARSQTLERPEVRLFCDTLVELLLKDGRTEEAMEAGQAFQQQSEVAGVDLASIVTPNAALAQDLRSLQQARERTGQLRAELQSAQVAGDRQASQELEGLLASNRAEFARTLMRLREREPEFEKLLSVRPSSFAKLQPLLPPQAVVVEYYSGQDRLYLFAMTREQLRIFSTPLSRLRLQQLVRDLRRNIVGRDNPVRESQALHAALVEPLQPMLQQHSLLVVIPSGILYYLPFAALQDTQGRHVVEQVACCTVTATELPALGSYRAGPTPSSLLALANPDGTLPGARREVEQTAGLFPRSACYFEANATRDKLQASSDVIHLATHGTLNCQNVNESYLTLAGKDGRLTTGEIYGLELDNVSLVTLSACQTALGEVNPGSEVASLAQAFSVAGSKSMLASLWRVEDDSTSALMVEFYRQLVAGKSKAEALRQAQLKVMQLPECRHPFFWAPFQLIGDWN